MVERASVDASKACAGRLYGAESHFEAIAERGHGTLSYAALKLVDAVLVDEFVDVVIPLAANRLQHVVAIDACLATKVVSVEGRLGPSRHVLLHPILHALEALAVGLVEVVLRLLQLFVGRDFSNLADYRLGQLQSHRLEHTHTERGIQQGEDDDINHHEIYLVVEGNEEEVHGAQAQQKAVGIEVFREVGMGEAPRQAKDVNYVVEI